MDERKYKRRILINDRFYIAECNYPKEHKEGHKEYAVFKFGNGTAAQELETFLAKSDEEAKKRGLEIAHRHNLIS